MNNFDGNTVMETHIGFAFLGSNGPTVQSGILDTLLTNNLIFLDGSGQSQTIWITSSSPMDGDTNYIMGKHNRWFNQNWFNG